MPKRTHIPKTVIMEIVREISKKMQIANNKVFRPYKIQLSAKNLSEILGKITESTSAEILTKRLGFEVVNAKKDADADLVFTKTGEKFEIKMTSTNNSWQGGEFSTRPYDYFLISWGGDFNEFFVARALLSTGAWRSNMKKRRYGITYYARDLYKNKTKEIFLGELITTPRGAIKIKRQKL
jgi:hypothetical protein